MIIKRVCVCVCVCAAVVCVCVFARVSLFVPPRVKWCLRGSRVVLFVCVCVFSRSWDAMIRYKFNAASANHALRIPGGTVVPASAIRRDIAALWGVRSHALELRNAQTGELVAGDDPVRRAQSICIRRVPFKRHPPLRAKHAALVGALRSELATFATTAVATEAVEAATEVATARKHSVGRRYALSLRCPVGGELLEDAMVLRCCGESVAAGVVVGADVCPCCGSASPSAAPNETLRAAARALNTDEFENARNK